MTTVVTSQTPARHVTSAARRWPRFAFMASAVVLALMTIESVLGFFVEGVYQEDTWAIAALRGNDLVTLGLVVPLFACAVARAERSNRWTLVWLGGLFYSVYNYAYYAFGTAFSDVFLLHVATMALSIAAMVSVALNIDPRAVVGPVVAARRDRLVAAYMLFVGSALTLAWGGLALRFALTDELPKNVMPPSAVHLVYALDLSLLAPAFLTGGFLLWQRKAWGYVLGAAVNLFGAAYLVVLEFVGGFEANAHISGTTWVSPPALGGAVLCAAAAVTLLRRVGSFPDRV